MRIRTLALGYLIGLGLLALAGTAAVLSQSWTRLSAVREMEQVLQVLDPGIRFVERLALERGVYNQVLVSKDAGPDGSNRLVSEQVAVTDALFDDMSGHIAKLPTGLADQLRGPVERARSLVSEARAEADPIWRDSLKVSPAVASNVVAKYTSAGSELEAAIGLAVRSVSSHDVGIGLMLEISRLSNDIRELAGQRSTILTRYVASLKAFSVPERVRVSELSGAIRATWQRLERISLQIGSPDIDRAVATMRDQFFGQGEPIYVAMADAARDGSAPAFGFAEWRRWTVGMLGQTLVARDPPIQQAIIQVAELREDAIDAFRLVFLGLGVVLLLVFLSGWMIEARVVRPIGRLTEALDQLASDERVRPSSAQDVSGLSSLYGARGDEIGSLARALSRLHRHASDLEQLNLRFHAVLSNLPQGVCLYDADENLVVANRRYSELYHVDPWAARPGVTLADVLQLRQLAGTSAERDGDDYVRNSLKTARPGQIVSCMVEQPGGRSISVQGTAVPGGGWLATHLDVTERSRVQAQITHMANHDSLTGLPNRSFFQKEMERGLKRISRGGKFSIMCLDLDRFKWVNDTLGHSFGDELLKQVAKRMELCVRETDFVARLGGDEFAIIFDSVPNEETVTGFAQRLIEKISEPYELDGHQAVIGTSIGIAIGPQDGREPHDLLKAADLALYRAKGDGRGTYRFFEEDIDAKMQRRRSLEIDLRKALQNKEFELHYQPIVDLASGEISGFEALLRWNHKTRGRVSPADFIPLAEETGQIVEIGAWVLRQACLEAKSWPKPVKVAVNLSPRQFTHVRLLADVTMALRESGLPANRLELEITEQVMLANTDTVLRLLHDLRQLGARISMDDFGTGYSSLSYLRRFPFDKIKIDQSFVRDLKPGDDTVAIVRAVVELAAGLRMSTTAEGVETQDQLDLLRAEGCTEVQGYLMSRPVPANEVPPMLVKGLKQRVAA